MHISEGYLPPGHAALALAAALPFVLLGHARYRALAREALAEGAVDRRPLVALLGAAVFTISLLPVPVPLAGTCSHPCGTPLAGILLGPRLATLLAAIALVLHALLFQHGGWTTWGANVLTLGVAGSAAALLSFRCARRLGLGVGLSAGVAGFLGDIVTYLAVAAVMGASIGAEGGRGLEAAGLIVLGFAPAQLPLAVVEGVVTSVVLRRLLAIRPGLLAERGRPGLSALPPPALAGAAAVLAALLATAAPARAETGDVAAPPSSSAAAAPSGPNKPGGPGRPPTPTADDASAEEDEPYGDATDVVLGGVAARSGRVGRPPRFSVGEGEVGRLMLILGGAAAGFVAGLSWRSLR